MKAAMRRFRRWEESGKLSDEDRAIQVAEKIHFEIKTWENIRGLRGWVGVAALYEDQNPKSALARRIRRLLHKFAAAQLVEIDFCRPGFGDRERRARFRVIRSSK